MDDEVPDVEVPWNLNFRDMRGATQVSGQVLTNGELFVAMNMV